MTAPGSPRAGKVAPWRMSSGGPMRPFLLLLAVVALHAGEADRLVTDQWFVGNINNQPSMTMHAVVLQKADGTSSDRVETNIVLNRALGGANVAFEVRDTQVYTVSAAGEITAFTFDHVENGVTTSATGTVADGKATVTVLRLGRATDSVVEIPAGTKLLGQQASPEQLAKATWKPGDQQKFSTLALLGAQVRVVTMTATHQKTAPDGSQTFGLAMDLMPVPTTMTLAPTGDLLGMTMDMGFLKLAFAPSKGPVPLVGAEL